MKRNGNGTRNEKDNGNSVTEIVMDMGIEIELATGIRIGTGMETGTGIRT